MSDRDLIRRGDVLKAVTSIAVFSLDSDELNAKAVSVIHRATQSIKAIPAIATQPDPRDEVIAAMVDALSELAIVADGAADLSRRYDHFKVHAMEPLYQATVIARAALAAAKAVQP